MKTIKKLKVSNDLNMLSRNELTTVKGGSGTSASISINTNPLLPQKKKRDTDPPKEIKFSMRSFRKI